MSEYLGPRKYRDSPEWVEVSLSELNESKIKGVCVDEKSSDLYVGRVVYDGEVVPCMLKLSDFDDECCCYIVLSNDDEVKELKITGCEMLKNSNTVQIKWKKASSDSELPTGRLQVGISKEDGTKLFIGRRMVKNRLCVVKVLDGEQRSDEVLVCTALTFYEDTTN